MYNNAIVVFKFSSKDFCEEDKFSKKSIAGCSDVGEGGVENIVLVDVGEGIVLEE